MFTSGLVWSACKNKRRWAECASHTVSTLGYGRVELNVHTCIFEVIGRIDVHIPTAITTSSV
jgi:hypothetical protein